MKRFLIPILIIVVFGAGVATSTLFSNWSISSVTDKASCDLSDESLLREINSYRSTKLLLAKDLDGFAQKRSVTVSKNFSHDGFAEGNDYLTKYKFYGENLYTGNVCYSKTVVDAWYESPTHKAVMLDSGYDSVGFGVTGNYVTAEFGDYR